MKKLWTLILTLLLITGLGLSEWRYNPFTGKLDYYEPVSGGALNDLSDVNAGSPNNNDVLTWNAATSRWTAQVAGAGSDVKVGIDALATAGYLGAAYNDGVLRVDAERLTYTDGGDFVTIDVALDNVTLVPIGGNINTYITAAAAGDTLMLSAGTYTVAAPLNVSKQLNIIGQGNAGLYSVVAGDLHGTRILCATDNIPIFNITSSNVRIAHMSLYHSGAGDVTGAVGITTATDLDGLVFTNIDVVMPSGNGIKIGFDIYGSIALLRDVAFYITSDNGRAYGVYAHNDSSTGIDAIVDCHTTTGTTIGGGIRSAPFYVFNDNDANTVTLNLFGSWAYSTNATANDVGAFANSLTTNNAILNAYNSTLNGGDFDLAQGGTNVATSYGSALINGTTSGTIVYGGTFQVGSIVSTGIAGPAASALTLNNAVTQDINLWAGVGSGNQSLTLHGWNTAGGDLEYAELTMDDANDEFLIQAANSANHEGITINLPETNQMFRVRQNSDAVQIYHNGTDAYIHTTDGQIILDTDEAAANAMIGLTDSDGSNEVYISAPALTGDWTLTLPTAVAAAANDIFTDSDGAGTATWQRLGDIVGIDNGATYANFGVAADDTLDEMFATIDANWGAATTWIALTDTNPANYVGATGKVVVVDADPDGLEFSDQISEITNGARISGTDDAILEMYDGALNALIQLSDAEGITDSVDMRIGLDETLRTLIICDDGDIETDFTNVAGSDPTISIRKNDGSTSEALNIWHDGISCTGYPFSISNMGQIYFRFRSDLASGHVFTFNSDSNDNLTDTNGHQAFLSIDADIAQTSTAAWSGIHMDVVLTSEGDGSTAEVGENALADFEADGVPIWNVCVEKVVKAHDSDLFDAVGLTDSATIWQQPANSILLSAVMVLNTQFAAVGLTDLDVPLGDAGANNGIIEDAMNLSSDAATTNYHQRGSIWDETAAVGFLFKDAAKDWIAYATAVGANLNTTSAGQVTFYFTYMKLK